MECQSILDIQTNAQEELSECLFVKVTEQKTKKIRRVKWNAFEYSSLFWFFGDSSKKTTKNNEE